MRTSIPLTIAATLLIAAPAVAQNNAVTTGNEVAAPEAADPLDANATMTADPANGVATDPMAAPMAADPSATDPAYAEPVADGDGDDDRFPWGLLGLLGLLGLRPSHPDDSYHPAPLD
jgi:hypothetical protein